MRQYAIGLLTVLSLLVAGCQVGPKVEFTTGTDGIDVSIDGQKIAGYLYGGSNYTLVEDAHKKDKGFLAKPVLHPVLSRSDVVLTRGYPLTLVEGEERDHPHHVGLSFTYDKINGSDFWNNTSPSPQIKHIETTRIKGGAGRGTLSTLIHWIGDDGDVLLEEKRDMVFLAEQDSDCYAIDFAITLKAMQPQVEFKDTKEGMFAIRVAEWLRERGHAATAEYLNDAGDVREKGVWGKRSRWVRLEGNRDGKVIGIAIMHHPSSVNYPTYWHARGYGLFSADPLGQLDFERKHNPENAKPFNLTLEKGQTARFGFRFIVYEGSLTPAQIEDQFAKFAKKKLF